ncbi:unnamed protein product, partial [Mesorhabditis spiculigera]
MTVFEYAPISNPTELYYIHCKTGRILPINSGGSRKSGSGSASSTSSTPSPTPPLPGTPSRGVPRYTSIDLEGELPQIFSTSLNPNLTDPDMTAFYSHPNLSRPYRTKAPSRHSPPPLYENSPGVTPSPSSKGSRFSFSSSQPATGRGWGRICWKTVIYAIPCLIILLIIIWSHAAYLYYEKTRKK